MHTYNFIVLVLVSKNSTLSSEISNKSFFHKYSDEYILVRKNIFHQKFALKSLILNCMRHYPFQQSKLIVSKLNTHTDKGTKHFVRSHYLFIIKLQMNTLRQLLHYHTSNYVAFKTCKHFI